MSRKEQLLKLNDLDLKRKSKIDWMSNGEFKEKKKRLSLKLKKLLGKRRKGLKLNKRKLRKRLKSKSVFDLRGKRNSDNNKNKKNICDRKWKKRNKKDKED